jgi:hypothetical protein
VQILVVENDELEKIEPKIILNQIEKSSGPTTTLIFLDKGTKPDSSHAEHWHEYIQYCTYLMSKNEQVDELSSDFKIK